MVQIVTIPITDQIDIGRARREAASLCSEAGLTTVASGCVVTSVSELAGNIWKYAHAGTITLRTEAEGDNPFIEVEADDLGPGIADIADALQDGYSTSDSLGSGLPGVRRLMDEFSVESAPGVGTRVIARKWAHAKRGA